MMFARISEYHVALSKKKTMHRVSLSSSVFSRGREPPSKVKKTKAVLKRAMTTRHGGRGKKRLGN